MSNSTSDPHELDPAETGTLLAEFGTGSGHHKMILVGLPLLFALFLGTWIYTLIKGEAQLSTGLIVGTVILLGLSALIMIAWLYCLAALHWRIFLFDKGLHFQGLRSSTWIPWNSVAWYWEKEVIMNGIPLGHTTFLQLESGKKQTIDQIFKNSPGLAKKIKASLVPELIHQAEAKLAGRQAVDFKLVVFREDGLQKGVDFLPWTSVDSLGIEDNKGIDYHVVGRALGEKKPWLDVPVTSFPNLDVFLHLTGRKIKQD